MPVAPACTAQRSCDHQWPRHVLPISCPPLESRSLAPDSRTSVWGTHAPSTCYVPPRCLVNVQRKNGRFDYNINEGIMHEG